MQKSRFIGCGTPVASEAAALAFLAEVRAQYRDANHCCYAYILGNNTQYGHTEVIRYSDDGEPGGTAGMPILGVMKARGVVDCAVVVARVFGGVLLGAGGLTRAYAQGAAIALDAAGVVVMHRTQRYLAEIAYPQWDRVAHALREDGRCVIEAQEFTECVTLTLRVREADAAGLVGLLTQITDGRSVCVLVEALFWGWDEG